MAGASFFPHELNHLYENAEFIGRGGFAQVFKARRRKDGDVVAVKIPLSLDETTGRSFLREITSWQRLSHNNIVSLYDANILPIPYLELEYVDGGSLENLAKPLEIARACRIVFDIAEGVKYAHSHGIVHRDLKPQNILITGENIPKITDWGLSKLIAESKSVSQYGYSPIYAAPEQISPSTFGKPDEKTDIYQTGVIFYNLITNNYPFKGEDLTEIASAIILKEPVSPSALNPSSREVEHIVLRCLAKRKEDRYQSIGELQEELAKFLKKDYCESLKLSVGTGDMKRSTFYCAELCLVHARLGDVNEALKFALDLRNYADGALRKEVDALIDGLKYRMESGLFIDEELFRKMEVIVHQVRMGWSRPDQLKQEDLPRKREEERSQLEVETERRMREEAERKKLEAELEQLKAEQMVREEAERKKREAAVEEAKRREEEQQWLEAERREREEAERKEKDDLQKVMPKVEKKPSHRKRWVAIAVIAIIVLSIYWVFTLIPPDIYFSDVRAYDDGVVVATVEGSDSVAIDSLEWIINSEVIDYSRIYVNGYPSYADTMIEEGDYVTIETGDYWTSGRIITFTVAHKASGELLEDMTVWVEEFLYT